MFVILYGSVFVEGECFVVVDFEMSVFVVCFVVDGDDVEVVFKLDEGCCVGEF